MGNEFSESNPDQKITERLFQFCKQGLDFNESEHSEQLKILRELLERNVNDIRDTAIAASNSPSPEIIFEKIRDLIRHEMAGRSRKR